MVQQKNEYFTYIFYVGSFKALDFLVAFVGDSADFGCFEAFVEANGQFVTYSHLHFLPNWTREWKRTSVSLVTQHIVSHFALIREHFAQTWNTWEKSRFFCHRNYFPPKILDAMNLIAICVHNDDKKCNYFPNDGKNEVRWNKNLCCTFAVTAGKNAYVEIIFIQTFRRLAKLALVALRAAHINNCQNSCSNFFVVILEAKSFDKLFIVVVSPVKCGPSFLMHH